MCIEHSSWQAINVHGHPNLSIVVIELGNRWPIALIDRFDIKCLSLIDEYHDARLSRSSQIKQFSFEWYSLIYKYLDIRKSNEFQLNKHLIHSTSS